MRASLPRLFWRQFEGATALLVRLFNTARWSVTRIMKEISSSSGKLYYVSLGLRGCQEMVYYLDERNK